MNIEHLKTKVEGIMHHELKDEADQIKNCFPSAFKLAQKLEYHLDEVEASVLYVEVYRNMTGIPQHGPHAVTLVTDHDTLKQYAIEVSNFQHAGVVITEWEEYKTKNLVEVYEEMETREGYKYMEEAGWKWGWWSPKIDEEYKKNVKELSDRLDMLNKLTEEE